MFEEAVLAQRRGQFHAWVNKLQATNFKYAGLEDANAFKEEFTKWVRPNGLSFHYPTTLV